MRNVIIAAALVVAGCEPQIVGSHGGHAGDNNVVTTVPEGSEPGTTSGTNGTVTGTSGTVTETIDADGDGFAVTDADGNVVDCNDNDPTINPGLATLDNSCDGIDQDCDGVDANDLPAPVPPTGGESSCGGIDNDGDGTMNVDGSGNVVDCDDNDATVSPLKPEVCDSKDNDCDTLVDEDGVCDVAIDTGTPLDTGAPIDTAAPVDTGVSMDLDGDGVTVAGGDCDDSDPAINPNVDDIPYDGIDQNCSGKDNVDFDCDGITAAEMGGEDCDDNNVNVNPLETEICGDGLDNDCDPSTSDVCPADPDADGDGSPDSVDCDVNDPAVFPGAIEVCGDGIDNDCANGDEACPVEPLCNGEDACFSGSVFYVTTARMPAGVADLDARLVCDEGSDLDYDPANGGDNMVSADGYYSFDTSNLGVDTYRCNIISSVTDTFDPVTLLNEIGWQWYDLGTACPGVGAMSELCYMTVDHGNWAEYNIKFEVQADGTVVGAGDGAVP